ncbi:MAG: hypothetical protein JSU72_15055, partial [Deltaproteobacteria bacterium]
KPQEMVDLTEIEVDELKEQAAKVSSATLQQIIQFLLRGEETIRRSSNPKLVLEMTLLRLVQLPQVMDIDRIISQMHKLEHRFAAGEEPRNTVPAVEEESVAQMAPRDYPQKVEENAGTEIVADYSPTKWQALLGRIRQEKPALAASLERASIKEPQPGHLEFDFNGHEFDYEMVRERGSLALLERLGREVFGQQTNFSLSAGGSQVKDKQQTQTGLQRQLRQKALKHPLVAEALEIFGGEIVEVRVGPEKEK